MTDPTSVTARADNERDLAMRIGPDGGLRMPMVVDAPSNSMWAPISDAELAAEADRLREAGIDMDHAFRVEYTTYGVWVHRYALDEHGCRYVEHGEVVTAEPTWHPLP